MDELFAYLYDNTIFADMETSYFFDIGNIFTALIRAFCQWITCGLAGIINGCEYLLKSAWKMLQFTNIEKYTDKAPAELLNILQGLMVVGITVSVVIVAVKLITSNKGLEYLKNFANNTLVLAVALLILPSVFSFANNKIFNANSSLLSANANNTSATIFFKHTTDYLYCYNKYVKDHIDETDLDSTVKNKDIKKLSDKDKDTGNWTLTKKNRFSKKLDKDNFIVDITKFNMNQTIDEDTGSQEDTEIDEADVPEFFRKRLTLKAATKFNNITTVEPSTLTTVISAITGQKTTGLRAGILGLGEEHYYRYRTDYLCVWIEMIANILLYVGASYALIKIMWEILINRLIIGVIGAGDLNNGEKLRKILSSILGLYLSIAFIAFTLQLYKYACNFASQTLEINDLAYSIIVVFLAMVALDGPNVVAKLFGVYTGMRGGVGMLAGGLMLAGRAARGARNLGRDVANAGSFGKNFMSNMRGSRAGTASPTSDAGMGNAFPFASRARNTRNSSQNPAQNSAQNFAQNPESLMDYKNSVLRSNPNMDREQIEHIANQKKANDDKDRIFNDAMIGQASSEMSNNRMSDADAVKSSMLTRSQGPNNDYDTKFTKPVADNLISNGAYVNYKNDRYNDIANDAKSLIANSDKYQANPIQAYEVAAGRAGATGETQKYMGNMAFAKSNITNIDNAANTYRNMQLNKGKKITKESAIASVIRENFNGCATGINPKYADTIAHNLSSEISNKSNKYNGRNRGASAFD